MSLDMRLRDVLEAEGYSHLRELPNGEVAGIYKFIFTTGLMVGLTAYSWRTRFCYEHGNDAIEALAEWDGEGFPPGYWIKQKPEGITNPERRP